LGRQNGNRSSCWMKEPYWKPWNSKDLKDTYAKAQMILKAPAAFSK